MSAPRMNDGSIGGAESAGEVAAAPSTPELDPEEDAASTRPSEPEAASEPVAESELEVAVDPEGVASVRPGAMVPEPTPDAESEGWTGPVDGGFPQAQRSDATPARKQARGRRHMKSTLNLAQMNPLIHSSGVLVRPGCNFALARDCLSDLSRILATGPPTDSRPRRRPSRIACVADSSYFRRADCSLFSRAGL